MPFSSFYGGEVPEDFYPIPTPVQLPSPTRLKLDLDKYISHYHVYRSFQSSWSHYPFIHYPIYRPDTEEDFAAGDHYFEHRDTATGKAFISFLFVICPGIDSDDPFYFTTQSTIFQGLSFYCVWNSIPAKLSPHIQDQLVEALPNHTSFVHPFVARILFFLAHFHQKPVPILPPTPLPTEPPEYYQE